MAAYAALVSLLNNIHAITNHPRFSTSLDNENIQPLLEKTGFLLGFIEGNNYVGGSEEAQDLERKITSAAHAAEDLIESHIVDQIHEARRSYLLKFLLKFVSCNVIHRFKNSHNLHQINKGMDAIIKEANELKEKDRSGEEQQPTHLVEPLMQSGESAMVGLDAELNQLLDELTGHQSSRRIISIVGMGGTGKTTLAKNVYENLLIKELFQVRAWATISQKNNPREVLSKLLSDVGESGSGTIDDLGLQLHKTLLVRRYLIILDDIWSVTAWDEVKRFFPDSNNGSRILLTTRLSNVALDCGSSLVTVNLLDAENSWKLFREKTFKNEECPPDLREVGEDIVKLCKGLPLSIVVIGGLLLNSPRTIGYWSHVASALKLIPDSKEKQESLDVLSLSYNYLPSHLKPCFLYMRVFREDSEIHVSKIIKLWVAEGFIKPIGSRLLEEIAEGFIKDLIDRNLILVGRRRKNGKVRSCSIHDLLRDLSMKLAEQEDFFHGSEGEIRGIERRLVDDWYTEAMGVRLRLPHLRSFITRGCIKQPSKYRLLRVLDEDGYDSTVDCYGNVNFRYLAYRKPTAINTQWELPTSMSLIWNLQILILKEGYESFIVASTDFWKMRQLRHVKCRRIYLPCPPRSEQVGLVMLDNLQTLKTVLNLRLCEEVCEIIPNIKKLYLEYDVELQGYDDGLIECLYNLDRLQKLESLNLSWPDSGIELNTKLATSFPRSLKQLSLSWCRLHWDVMTVIGALPQLEVLKLEHLKVCGGGEWSPVDGQFRRLKFLKIMSGHLARWDVENSHFPVLEKLFLSSLHDLDEIPLSIGDIPTLQLIDVDYCCNSAAISAIKLKEDQLENDSLQVHVKVWRADMWSFNQMLKIEGLTVNNIHFQIL